MNLKINMSCAVIALGFIVSGCETGTDPTPACFVCSDQMPHARYCSTQIGRLEFDGDLYTCNLYFGANQLCESPEYCCRKMGLLLNEQERCVDAENMGENTDSTRELSSISD